jgi:hypothetical protein
MDFRNTVKRTFLALAIAGSTLVGSTVAPVVANASGTTPTGALAGTSSAAYVGKLTCCPTLVLGPQSSPTVVVQTPPLPAGNYLVSAFAGGVIASNDQIVCAIGPSNAPTSNDGIFGTAGNDGTSGFIYGSAPIVDSWTITTAGTSLDLVCNSFNYGKGTYVAGAAISALKVGTLVVN